MPTIPDWEIDRLHQKIAAGAHFAMTQIAYDAAGCSAFWISLAQYQSADSWLLPVQSYRHASFLHNEVPGITLTEERWNE
jgi:homocysteine S-methyltransferase